MVLALETILTSLLASGRFSRTLLDSFCGVLLFFGLVARIHPAFLVGAIHATFFGSHVAQPLGTKIGIMTEFSCRRCTRLLSHGNVLILESLRKQCRCPMMFRVDSCVIPDQTGCRSPLRSLTGLNETCPKPLVIGHLPAT